MNTEQALDKARELTIEAMDSSFVMGMNYQRLTTLELVIQLCDVLGFDNEQTTIITHKLGLLKEATDADIPTRSDI